jgi:hypothetical protein
MSSYTEDDMAEAILDHTDCGFSLNKAAKRRSIPKPIFIDRMKGREVEGT